MKEFTVKVRQVELGEPDDRDMSDCQWAVMVSCLDTDTFGEGTSNNIGKAFAAAYLSVCHQLVNDDEE